MRTLYIIRFTSAKLKQRIVMEKGKTPAVTICIPHWQVKELITICLRAIRKFTRDVPYEVIVVDNGSEDESLDYLRNLPWIKLIQRGDGTSANPSEAHRTALDIALKNCQSDYFVAMHTDTIVKHPDWLKRMVRPFENDQRCGAVGAWKLELRNPLYEFTKKITDTKKFKLWLRRTLLRDKNARQLKRELCPRDYCAVYRAEPLRKHRLKFNANGPYAGYTAGEQMYYQLKDKGYHAHVIPTAEMMKYMVHLAHATAGLRPKQRHLNHWKAQKKSERKIRKFFNSPLVKQLQQEKSLDK